MKLAPTSRNLAAAVVGAECNNGFFRVFSTSGKLLAELRFSPRAFLTARDGTIDANPMPPVTVLAKGTAARFEALKADGKTLVYEGTVGLEDKKNPPDLVFNSVEFQTGAVVSLDSITYTQP